MTICSDCADKKGLIPKDKVVGVWVQECPYCKQQKTVCSESHDYTYPGQKPVTLHDILIYEADND